MFLYLFSTDTPESAALTTLLSAGILRHVTKSCTNHANTNCTCVYHLG